jgi:hypothetical protein
MSSPSVPPSAAPLQPEDFALLESLRQGGEWLRAVLCTLARRGRAFRDAEPERAGALLDALRVYPWYKGGQFLFDLMEWEDFMLEGPPPPILPTILDAAALSRLAASLHRLKAHLDSSSADAELPAVSGPLLAADAELPPLEPGMYLYEDVVLGAIWSVLPALRASLAQA